ncbi:MAG: CPBP family intramembrane glutamic endopeptidase [Planctomycetaceae bacterium]
MDEIASVLQMLILLSSMGVWWGIVQRLHQGQPLLSRSVPVTRPRPLIAIAVAVTWVLLQCVGLLLSRNQSQPVDKFNEASALGLLIYNLCVQIITACVMVVSLTRLGRQGLTRFGFDLRHANESILIGVLGYFAAVIPVIVANVAISPLRTEDNQHVFLQILNAQQSVPLVALMSASAVVMAPIEEELLYRVIFQGTLQRHLSPLGSILVSSVVFSSVHGFPDAIGLFPLALILGYLYWRTGSYLTVVTTHAMFNGVTVLLTLLSPVSEAVNG